MNNIIELEVYRQRRFVMYKLLQRLGWGKGALSRNKNGYLLFGAKVGRTQSQVIRKLRGYKSK